MLMLMLVHADDASALMHADAGAMVLAGALMHADAAMAHHAVAGALIHDDAGALMHV